MGSGVAAAACSLLRDATPLGYNGQLFLLAPSGLFLSKLIPVYCSMLRGMEYGLPEEWFCHLTVFGIALTKTGFAGGKTAVCLQGDTGIRPLRLLERILEEVEMELPGAPQESPGGPQESPGGPAGPAGVGDKLFFSFSGGFCCLQERVCEKWWWFSLYAPEGRAFSFLNKKATPCGVYEGEPPGCVEKGESMGVVSVCARILT